MPELTFFKLDPNIFFLETLYPSPKYAFAMNNYLPQVSKQGSVPETYC